MVSTVLHLPDVGAMALQAPLCQRPATSSARRTPTALPPPLPPLPDCLGGETRFQPRGSFSQHTASQRSVCSSTPKQSSEPPAVPKVCSGTLATTFDVQEQNTEVASIQAAAKARKGRLKDAVTGHADGSAWVERSELSDGARRAVRSWATGAISGTQCLLWLLRSTCVTRLVEQARNSGGKQELAEEDLQRLEGRVWIAGCSSLGVGNVAGGFEFLAAEMELKTPTEILMDAWNAVEGECGASAERLAFDEINLAFRRLSQRAISFAGAVSLPVRFLQVQLWRELVRVHMGCENADEDHRMRSAEEDDVCPPKSFPKRHVPMSVDLPVLGRLSHSDTALQHEAATLSAARLRQETADAEEYAVQLLMLGNRLRRALGKWSHFDAYRVLGVARSASLAEVRRAFYRRALKDHPDKGGSKEAFQELQRAYDEVVMEKSAHKGSDADLEGEFHEKHGEEHDAEQQRRWEQWFEDQRKRRTNNSKNTKHEAETSSSACEKRANPNPDLDSVTLNGNRSNETGGLDASNETQAFNDSGDEDDEVTVRALKELYADVQEAAEQAGAHATRAMRHCQAVAEMFETGLTVDADFIWNRVARAMESATQVANAAKIAGQRSGIVAGMLEELTEHGPLAVGCGSRTNATCEDGSALDPPRTPLEETARSVSDASCAVNEAATECATAVVDVQTMLRSQRCVALCKDGRRSESDDARAAAESVRPLTEASRAAAVAAIEAAEACAEAIDATRAAAAARRTHDDDIEDIQNGSRDSAKFADAGESKIRSQKCMTEEERWQQEKIQAEETRKASELRKLTKCWLDVHRTLRRENSEVLELQRQARVLLQRDRSAIPDIPDEQRSQVFDLLAEFLDQAAVEFHETLLSATGSNASSNDKQPALSANVIHTAASDAFRFIQPPDDCIAIPVDPRTQVLQAALALDPVAVRGMLLVQLQRRLEGSVAFARSVGIGRRPDADRNDEVDKVLRSIREHFQTASICVAAAA